MLCLHENFKPSKTRSLKLLKIFFFLLSISSPKNELTKFKNRFPNFFQNFLWSESFLAFFSLFFQNMKPGKSLCDFCNKCTSSFRRMF